MSDAPWVAPGSGTAAPPARPVTVVAPVTAASTGAPPALRPLSPSQLLDGGCRVLHRQARVLLPVVLAVSLPLHLVNIWATRILVSDNGALSSNIFDFDQSGSTGGQTAALWAAILLDSLGLMLAGAAIARITAADRLGESITARQALGVMARRSGVLVLAWFLGHGLIALGGCVAVGGVAFMTLFIVTAPVIALEGAGPVVALRRSWSLVIRRFWPCLGFALLSALLVALLNAALTALPLALGLFGPIERWDWLVASIADALALLVVVPIVCASTTLLYLDLRLRTEGLDLELDRTSAFP